METDSIESVLLAMNQARMDRIADRLKIRDSILGNQDYDAFETLLNEAHAKAKTRWEKTNERNTNRPGDSESDSEGAERAERSETSDDA